MTSRTSSPEKPAKWSVLCTSPYIGPGQSFPLSCSVGISVYPDDGRTVIDLFKSADAAMYASKQHGKDRYSRE